MLDSDLLLAGPIPNRTLEVPATCEAWGYPRRHCPGRRAYPISTARRYRRGCSLGGASGFARDEGETTGHNGRLFSGRQQPISQSYAAEQPTSATSDAVGSPPLRAVYRALPAGLCISSRPEQAPTRPGEIGSSGSISESWREILTRAASSSVERRISSTSADKVLNAPNPLRRFLGQCWRAGGCRDRGRQQGDTSACERFPDPEQRASR
jgi:hypothetical protein